MESRLKGNISENDLFLFTQRMFGAVNIAHILGVRLQKMGCSPTHIWTSIVEKGPGGKYLVHASTQKQRSNSDSKKKFMQVMKAKESLDIMRSFPKGYKNDPPVVSIVMNYTCMAANRPMGGGKEGARKIDPHLTIHFGKQNAPEVLSRVVEDIMFIGPSLKEHFNKGCHYMAPAEIVTKDSSRVVHLCVAETIKDFIDTSYVQPETLKDGMFEFIEDAPI
jgi:hypothetical protein